MNSNTEKIMGLLDEFQLMRGMWLEGLLFGYDTGTVSKVEIVDEIMSDVDKLHANLAALRAFWRDEIPFGTKNELREFHSEVYARWMGLLDETEEVEDKIRPILEK